MFLLRQGQQENDAFFHGPFILKEEFYNDGLHNV